MDKLRITGGRQLHGSIEISGAKNSALPQICAALLTTEPVTLTNVPALSDMDSMNQLMQHIGAKITKTSKHSYTYETRDVKSFQAPYDYVRKMRASYYVLGPLLARYGQCDLSLPGGCAIGARPMDIHIDSLKKMGADIDINNGYIQAKTQGRLKGTTITFPKTSVGATFNIMMAATLAQGTTILENCALEPEIADLAGLLNSMGAKISGINTKTLTIQGVDELHAAANEIIYDRIEAGSYAVIAAITGSRITLKNACPQNFELPLTIMQQMGVGIEKTGNDVIIDARGKALTSHDITTQPFPGFPTDLQAQFMILALLAKGDSVFRETIFENRFMHVAELLRMNADITLNGDSEAIVRGGRPLRGAPVMASDLRASFA
ncbi:MAG: UDP-N-acetylglucosamine 1-carboxyvinyltransferase, partial [Alphaproteobacteria bacterium]|nr:UDP-N-acetylglucosamine 1-carboxyvinyltransferase [Alphaproteobacteria bacterium]